MSTFITKLDAHGEGVRVAVKDIIDVEGVPTTAGCRAVERSADPAKVDAACLAGIRAAGARIVGKTNLHELAMLPLGTNPWFGAPVNPLDAQLIPGGSSSGSAVAVANGDADVAIGSDTGGSIRVPSACCGTVGLKTTYGRVPLDGVWPLAPSLDTIGPMGRTVADVITGMQLLEPGFQPSNRPARVIGRIRTAADPDIEAAVDAVLHASGLEIVTLAWDGLDLGGQAFLSIFFNEIWDTDHDLVETHPEGVGSDIAMTIELAGTAVGDTGDARRAQDALRQSIAELFTRVDVLALPTMPLLPPRLDAVNPETLVGLCIDVTKHVAPFNVAGNPCVAQPVPIPNRSVPASLQLVGPLNGEELLVATAAHIEAAADQV